MSDRVSDHGYSGGGPPPPIAGDAASFPSDAELARTLAATAGRAALSTLTADGTPFGSVVSIVVDEHGQPVMCISALAEHTINARRDRRASVLIAEPVAEGDDPLAAARLTLIGKLVEHDEAPGDVRARYLDRHPSAGYIDYSDFSWWSLVPSSVRYVGGFGHMSWVTMEEYRAASPDPIAPSAASICAHMNDDHADANLRYARSLADLPDATAARMTAVDRHGFTLDVDTPSGPRVARLAFPVPVTSPEEVRRAVIELLATTGPRPS
jgi:putative heme iron utilization protein